MVIFDMDDTLYPEKDYVRSGYKQIALNNPDIVGMEQKLWQAFENGEQAIDYVLQAQGVYSKEKAMECLEIYRRQMPDIHLYNDARVLMDYLKDRRIRFGMITDGRPEGQWAKIEALGIRDCFEKIIVTDELGGVEFRKPNPLAFELMQKHFDVPFEQIVYIGDNPRKDFIAPQKLGMGCVHFLNKDGLYYEK
ncbi:MAG: HAD family hydrolase [Clostridia bacterium]|nr:HAD family hydrolase [Clostridia bacterium]